MVDKTTRLLRRMINKPRAQKRTPIATDLFLPNLSGDHSRGKVLTTPTDAKHIANKEYVDSLATGKKSVCLIPFESDIDTAITNGTVAFTIPADMDGFDLTAATASVHTKGVTGTLDIQLRKRRAGADFDMLSTKITIGDEWHASDGVVENTTKNVSTGDQIYADVDAIHTGTAAKGCSVTITFS